MTQPDQLEAAFHAGLGAVQDFLVQRYALAIDIRWTSEVATITFRHRNAIELEHHIVSLLEPPVGHCITLQVRAVPP